MCVSTMEKESTMIGSGPTGLCFYEVGYAVCLLTLRMHQAPTFFSLLLKAKRHRIHAIREHERKQN
ncbi:hypothetical protein C6341_g445 [Phytophthora cactorum]|nr:hypothetical protein C6341_g445 [Phytophthora cactorum]